MAARQLAQGVSASRRAATELSHPQPPTDRIFRGFAQLARRSLILLPVTLALPACIVPDPPNFEGEVQRGPFLLLDDAIPSISQVHQVSVGEPTVFEVPFQSEDVGEEVFGAFHLDFEGDRQLRGLIDFLDPGTLSEQRDPVEFAYTFAPSEAGCRNVTLLLAHRSRISPVTGLPRPQADGGADAGTPGVGRASWWFDVRDPSNPQSPLVEDCGEVTQ